MYFITPGAVLKASNLLKLSQLQKGDVIFKEGDKSDYFYGIIKGSIGIKIKIPIFDENKKIIGYDELVKVHLKEGECFGEMGLINNCPRTATAFADTETFLFIVDTELFNTYFKKHLTQGELAKKKFIITHLNPSESPNTLTFDKFYKALGTKFFMKGEVIFTNNDFAEKIFLIFKGECCIVKEDKKTKQQINVLKCSIGDVCGLEALEYHPTKNKCKYNNTLVSSSLNTIIIFCYYNKIMKNKDTIEYLRSMETRKEQLIHFFYDERKIILEKKKKILGMEKVKDETAENTKLINSIQKANKFKLDDDKADFRSNLFKNFDITSSNFNQISISMNNNNKYNGISPYYSSNPHQKNEYSQNSNSNNNPRFNRNAHLNNTTKEGSIFNSIANKNLMFSNSRYTSEDVKEEEFSFKDKKVFLTSLGKLKEEETSCKSQFNSQENIICKKKNLVLKKAKNLTKQTTTQHNQKISIIEKCFVGLKDKSKSKGKSSAINNNQQSQQYPTSCQKNEIKPCIKLQITPDKGGIEFSSPKNTCFNKTSGLFGKFFTPKTQRNQRNSNQINQMLSGNEQSKNGFYDAVNSKDSINQIIIINQPVIESCFKTSENNNIRGPNNENGGIKITDKNHDSGESLAVYSEEGNQNKVREVAFKLDSVEKAKFAPPRKVRKSHSHTNLRRPSELNALERNFLDFTMLKENTYRYKLKKLKKNTLSKLKTETQGLNNICNYSSNNDSFQQNSLDNKINKIGNNGYNNGIILINNNTNTDIAKDCFQVENTARFNKALIKDTNSTHNNKQPVIKSCILSKQGINTSISNQINEFNSSKHKNITQLFTFNNKFSISNSQQTVLSTEGAEGLVASKFSTINNIDNNDENNFNNTRNRIKNDNKNIIITENTSNQGEISNKRSKLESPSKKQLLSSQDCCVKGKLTYGEMYFQKILRKCQKFNSLKSKIFIDSGSFNLPMMTFVNKSEKDLLPTIYPHKQK